MKFFFKKPDLLKKNKKIAVIDLSITKLLDPNQQTYSSNTNLIKKNPKKFNNSLVLKTIKILPNFFLTCGGKNKTNLLLSKIVKKTNLFFLKNEDYLVSNYKEASTILQEIFFKNLNFNSLILNTINLIKPPFVIKAVVLPKKLKKKSKNRYITKIVYKSDSKRVNNAIKQLYYNANNFIENKFVVRLYKSIILTFLEQKNSKLYKLKSSIFKKFFKF